MPKITLLPAGSTLTGDDIFPVVNSPGASPVAQRYTITQLATFLFSTKVAAIAATTATASINAPHGTAPTTPVNGDVWTTTAGMYVRINGATVGPLAASGAAAAGSLTGATLAANVLASSLTSVGTLATLTVGGLLLTVLSATGGAGFRLPHGAAPTSPVDGDTWTTTAGMYARINGVTVGPLAASGAAAAGSLTGATLAANVLASSLTSVGTLSTLTVGGLLLTVLSATGGAGFRLPHGAAPTSPVNGDTWTTTAGMYARINGATVGPFGAGGGTISGSGSANVIALFTTASAIGDSGLTQAANDITSTKALIAPATTTTIASFRAPHGTAPTTPVNGDIWTTTAGLYVRVNGATVGPLGSGGSGLPTTGGTMTGAILFSADNTIDFGASGATRARTGYFGTSVVAPNFTGVASSATILATARTINGVSFDGSANITVTAAGSTLTGTSLAAAIVSSSLTSVGTLATLTVGGLLLTVLSATGGAGFRLPHGAAPTSPVNGDVWTTTAGMYVRINGVTVGPLGAGIGLARSVPIYGLLSPDTTGSVWWEPWGIGAANDLYGSDQVLVFADTATKISASARVKVPIDYAATGATLVLVWCCVPTTGNAVWDGDYRAIAVGESFDPTTHQESVTATTAANGTARTLVESRMTLTHGNLAVGDQFAVTVSRDGASSDTIAGSLYLVDAYLEHTAL